MMKSDNPEEEVVGLTYVGHFRTLNGEYKVLTVVLKINRPEEPRK